MSHLWMRHVTPMNVSCHTYECVTSHIWRRHVTHIKNNMSKMSWRGGGGNQVLQKRQKEIKETRHTYGWVVSHVWMSHVTHIKGVWTRWRRQSSATKERMRTEIAKASLWISLANSLLTSCKVLCGSVLQCVAVCCSVVQCVAVCCKLFAGVMQGVYIFCKRATNHRVLLRKMTYEDKASYDVMQGVYIFRWNAWHDVFLGRAWLIHVCVMAHSYVWHDAFICAAWLIRMCETTRPYVWHVSFICVTWLVPTCDMTIHTWDMTHFYVWHDLFICVTWRFKCVTWLSTCVTWIPKASL